MRHPGHHTLVLGLLRKDITPVSLCQHHSHHDGVGVANKGQV